MALKYVMFEDNVGNRLPVVFPEEISHSSIAKGAELDKLKPVSAGFLRNKGPVVVGDVKRGEIKQQWEVYGKSDSLGLKSSKADAELLDYMMVGLSGLELRNLIAFARVVDGTSLSGSVIGK